METPIYQSCGKSLGIKHGQHIDYNLAKIGSYDQLRNGEFVSLCFKPADSQARLSNLLLTMLQKMEIEATTFVDSTGPVSELLT
jgi:hypothetical protein